jgi:Zn finger protein HypA/HybF involved in hydrogenase expression
MNSRNNKFLLLMAVVLMAVFPLIAGRSDGPLTVVQAQAQSNVKSPHGDYKEDCSLCHRADGWKPAKISKKFDHEKFGVPLQGAHASVACTQCHTSLDFKMAPTACVDCHSDVHNAELGSDCARCHGTRSFIDRNDQIRMHRLTRFPLGGAHQTLDCEMCHRLSAPGSLSYVNTSTECVSCHMNDYNGTTSPNHVAAGYSQDCTGCHNEQSWDRAGFDHNQTAFPLTGMHATIACENCHVGGVFTGLPTACVSCHQKDYDGTVNPQHAGAGLPTTCEDCHGTRSWGGGDFNHGARTGFVIDGGHVGLPCSDCHLNNVFTGLSGTCVSCHQADFNGTIDPNHVATNFSTDCLQCHTTARWTGATFNHSTTSFPLLGAHLAVACNACHVGGVYAGTPTACISCHQTDYNGTTNPNHPAANYPTDCLQCHGMSGWAGASFNHSTTAFPLTGSHMTVACAGCHVNNVYAGTPTACVGCHQSDYNGTTNPNHAAAGFTTDCQPCHNTTTWAGATFNHNQWFPIYSGKHAGRWQTCDECHTNAASYADFTCLSCHPHSDKNKTDGAHQGRNGYSYDSNACYRCHPDGRT